MIKNISGAIILVALLGTAGTARANDLAWLALPASGHVADYLSSVQFSTTPGTLCQEANPWARHPDGTFDARKGAVGLAIGVGAEYVLLRLTQRSRDERTRWIGKAVAVGIGGFTWGNAAANWSHLTCEVR